MMAERYPMTVVQRQLLNQDLADIRGTLDDIVSLLRACSGDNAEASVRAEEPSRLRSKRLAWL